MMQVYLQTFAMSKVSCHRRQQKQITNYLLWYMVIITATTPLVLLHSLKKVSESMAI